MPDHRQGGPCGLVIGVSPLLHHRVCANVTALSGRLATVILNALTMAYGAHALRAGGRSPDQEPRAGGSLRPDIVGNPNANSDATAERVAFLDPRAYQLQPVDTPGNAPRNSVWGPGYVTVDASLVKRVMIGDHHADFRLEAFNLLNTTNYQSPGATWGASNVGVISDTVDPRVVQVAVRFAF